MALEVKSNGSPLAVKFDGVGNTGIRAIKRGASILRDSEMLQKVQKYEKDRYGKAKIVNEIGRQAKLNASIDLKESKKLQQFKTLGNRSPRHKTPLPSNTITPKSIEQFNSKNLRQNSRNSAMKARSLNRSNQSKPFISIYNQ